MKKYNKYFVISLLVVFSLVMTGMADAASTIGTNMSTTGTFTQTVGSATAAQFQNAAGTINTLTVDTTNTRVGVGTASVTTFEVQGTASASYFYTRNTIQVAGTTASVAYNRFGSSATTHSLSATNDVLINGILEVDGKTFLDGTASVASDFEVGGIASISSIVYLTNGQIRPGTGGNSATAFRFQNAAGTTTVLTIDTTSGLYGRVGVGKTPSTIFDVKGTASASNGFFSGSMQAAGTTGASVAYSRFGTGTTTHSGDVDASNDLLITGALEVDGNSFFDGKASISSNLQISGRFIADTAASHSFVGDMIITSNLILGATTASSSGGLYVAEFGASKTGTASFLFAGGNSSSTGTCFQLKDTVGKWIYMRFNTGSTTPTLSTIRCQ